MRSIVCLPLVKLPNRLKNAGAELDVFNDQYAKLQTALKKAQEGEQRFMLKCKSLAKLIRTGLLPVSSGHRFHELG